MGKRMWRRYWACLLLLALGALPGPDADARVSGIPPQADTCTKGPVADYIDQLDKLEEQRDHWGVFCEPSPSTGGYSEWTLDLVSDLALDPPALECALTGGAPYSNIHCYRNLQPDLSATVITYTLSFMLLPGPTCTDFVTACVQALEFTASRWHEKQRYEWAVQWQNIGGPCPRWRYWDFSNPDGWVPLNPERIETLHPNKWYDLTLVGAVDGQRARYLWFDLHEHGAAPQIYAFRRTTASTRPAPTFPNLLAVAIQLDGNSIQQPYSVIVDEVALHHSPSVVFQGGPNAVYMPISGAYHPTPQC